MSLYLPVFGRCFSNRPSSFRTTPPVTVLVVVFCVPMPISRVSALAAADAKPKVAATSKDRKPERLDAGPTVIRQILFELDCAGFCAMPTRNAPATEEWLGARR